MIEVDRRMVYKLNVPIELMMEHAGLALARLAVALSNRQNTEFYVIAGSGNNGGGGLVAARRLLNWNHDVTVIVPKGFPSLGDVPKTQLRRLQDMAAYPEEKLPDNLPEEATVLDAYIGYGYYRRVDKLTTQVFDRLKHHNKVISLDASSGLDVTTGESDSGIEPIATLTIAFVKTGLLLAAPQYVGELYICDIGVPSDAYLNYLEIDWSEPYDAGAIDRLSDAFATDPLVRVQLNRSDNYQCWNV
jgi:NAD(P)H-hydrate epimerase